MVSFLKLLAPALFPSWDFFKSVEASPRVEWRVLRSASEGAGPWRPFKPRPNSLPIWRAIARLVWNPHWNDALYVVSLAERIIDKPTDHSIAAIRQRILRDLADHARAPEDAHFMQFRLVLIHRRGAALSRDTVFVAAACPLGQPAP